MSVRIRLRRIGRKKQPYYRLVVVDIHKSRDGAYIDQVGYYNPRRQPALLQIDLEKVEGWLARGAELSESAASLVRKARRGGDEKVALAAPDTPAQAAAGPVPEAPVEAAVAATVTVEAAAPAPAEEAAPEAPTAEQGEAAPAAETEPEAGA